MAAVHGAPPPTAPSRTPLGSVEVLRDGARVWYCGHVVDLGPKDTLTVAYDGDTWPKADVELHKIRKPPKLKESDFDMFDPKAGDEVEVKLQATEHAPAGWAMATVRNIKHTFYFVARSGVASGPSEIENAENIVEKEFLRPVTRMQTLLATGLQQEIYKLPPGLQGWTATLDALGCFAHIEDQSGLIFLRVQKGGLKLCGDGKNIYRAKMLLEVHVKHQVRIQSFQDQREKGLKALETKRNRIEGTGYKHSVEIKVGPMFIARIIGKNGDVDLMKLKCTAVLLLACGWIQNRAPATRRRGLVMDED